MTSRLATWLVEMAEGVAAAVVVVFAVGVLLAVRWVETW
jgi:hypothetical protein